MQLMILVDDAGGILPSINHSPWNGITLADLVMPFFLFIVGVSLGFTYKVPLSLEIYCSYVKLSSTIIFAKMTLQAGICILLSLINFTMLYLKTSLKCILNFC